MNSTLGEFMFTGTMSGSGPSLRQLVDSGKRVVVSYNYNMDDFVTRAG